MKSLALALVGLLFVSCGGGGVSSGPTGIPQDQACTQAATSFCTKIYGCTDQTSKSLQTILMSEPSCEASVLQYCGSTAFRCSEGATYHPEQALACKNKFTAQDCATLSAGLVVAFLSGSTSAAVASITANVPECTNICTGGVDGGGPG